MVKLSLSSIAGAFLALLFSPDLFAADPPRRIVFVAVGHSNMRGESETIFPPADRVSFWDDQRKDWVKLAKGEGFYTLRDPITPLANLVAKENPGVEIGVVKIIENGANLKDNWLRGKRNYELAVKAVKEVTARGDVVACLFPIVGWREAGRFAHEEPNRKVLENYVSFLTAFREDTGMKDLPVVASQVEAGFQSKEFQTMEAWERVHDQIAKLPAALKGVALVEVKDLGSKPNDHHFSTAGNTEWANRALVAMKQLNVMDRALAAARGAGKPVASTTPTVVVHGANDVLAEVTATSIRTTKPRTLAHLGTYKNCYAIHEWAVSGAAGGKLSAGDKILVVEQVIADRKLLPAYERKQGEKLRLKLASWDAQKERKAEPLDDDILDLDRPLYYALTVEKAP